MEQLDYNLLFRWFVGLSLDVEVWDVTIFTKNGDRLIAGDIAAQFVSAVLEQFTERTAMQPSAIRRNKGPSNRCRSLWLFSLCPAGPITALIRRCRGRCQRYWFAGKRAGGQDRVSAS
jgi:hypothetical protein